MLNETFSVIFKHSAQVSKVIHSSFPKFDTCLFLFFLTDDEFLPKWNAHTLYNFQALGSSQMTLLPRKLMTMLTACSSTSLLNICRCEPTPTRQPNTYQNAGNNQNSITLQPNSCAEKMA